MFKLLPLYLCLLCLVVQPVLPAYLFSPPESVISDSYSASENGSGYEGEYEITPERWGTARKQNRAKEIYQMMRNRMFRNPGYPKTKKQQNDSSKGGIVNDKAETENTEKKTVDETNVTGSGPSITDKKLDTVSTTLQDIMWYLAVIIVLCYVIYCIYYLTLLKEIYRDSKKRNTSDDPEEEEEEYDFVYSEYEEDNFEKVEADLSNFIE